MRIRPRPARGVNPYFSQYLKTGYRYRWLDLMIARALIPMLRHIHSQADGWDTPDRETIETYARAAAWYWRTRKRAS